VPVVTDDDQLTLKEAWELLMRACGTLDDQIEILEQLKELPMFARRGRRGLYQLVNREDWWPRSLRISPPEFLDEGGDVVPMPGEESALLFYKRNSDEVDEDNSFFECTFCRGDVERLAKSWLEDAAETEGTRWQRDAAIAAIKTLHPPDGIPTKRTTNEAMRKQLNRLPQFQDKPIRSKETVRQARAEIEASRGQK
jgi:hypothetical protein